MGRPRDNSPLPAHPAIVEGPYHGRYLGKGRMMVRIRCPRCKTKRERTASETRKEMERESFRGFCRPCALLSVADGTHVWGSPSKGKRDLITHPRRGVQSSGYSLTYPNEVESELLPMYRVMQTSGQPLLAHRWAMAKFLGRPLTSEELVDHRNGVKSDNRVSLIDTRNNLRIYVRGKQQPGSAPGHGTYYHEWQTALKELADTREEVIRLRHLPHQAQQSE